jgi:class 3 adenylate cyclase/pimeloyl-ACP methyl ester carboxylesterase
MELRMQYATTRDGVRIAFGVAGSGPWLVRVPSLPFTHTQLEWSQGSDFFDQLAANWSVVQFDPRGSGFSDRDVADLSLEARIQDLEAVVERLGIETFALHGIGWSGPVVVTYAVRHPERVTHLILDDAQIRIADFMNIPQIRALDQLRSDWDSFLEFLVFAMYGIGRDKAEPIVQYLRACVSQDGASRIFDTLRGDDATDLLEQVAAPTLIVQHGGVARQSLDGAREIAARIPNARLVVLGGGVQDETGRIFHEIAELLGTDAAAPHKHAHADASSGVRAILFTDVVEHTAIMRRLGDEKGRDVLREHERITRDVLKAYAGEEVKTMGDGFMASFSSVTKAVECAIALQRAFAERNESAEEPLHVRVGLNAGEPIEEEGDLFGSTVILAARIAAAAEGGQVLASMAVRELCSGKGLLFADRGDFVAKGFEDPVRMFEVSWREH